MYLVQQAEASFVTRSGMNNRFADARTKGRMSDAKMLFYNFAVHVTELPNRLHLVRRAEGNTELCLEVQSAMIAFADANVSRLPSADHWHRATIATLRTIENQARLQAAVTPRLSHTISFDDEYLALLHDDFHSEPDQVGEDRKPLPAALPEFENGMRRVHLSSPSCGERAITFLREGGRVTSKLLNA